MNETKHKRPDAMRHPLARRNSNPTSAGAERVPSVCVVDPRSSDYRAWLALAETNGVQLHFVDSAEAALRIAHAEQIDLWVVNTALPGLSGCELCGMLTSRSKRTAVYLVADSYSVAAEQQAWRAKATLFGCKPAHSEWLSQWIQHSVNRAPLHSSAKMHAALSTGS